MRKILAAASIALAATAAIAGPAISAADDIDATVAPAVLVQAPSNYCTDRLITRYGGTWYGGIASCSGLRYTRWRVIVVCYGSNKLEGFPTYVGSATQTGSRSNVTVWCYSSKRFGYNTYVIFYN